MKISATVESAFREHTAHVATEGAVKEIPIPHKSSGYGSSVNGGELLFLALATCFCNDLYREATEQDITLTRVVVHVTGSFAGPGEGARNITYKVHLEGDASPEVLDALLRHTDTVAEVQNTLRAGTPVKLVSY